MGGKRGDHQGTGEDIPWARGPSAAGGCTGAVRPAAPGWGSRSQDGDHSPWMPCGLRGWFCSRQPLCVEHRAGREQQLPQHKPPQGYLSSNTGDLSCSPVISHTPVAAVSPIIFSQCLSVCFCIKHEVKQEVGSCFSVLLGAAFVALFRYTGKICQVSGLQLPTVTGVKVARNFLEKHC